MVRSKINKETRNAGKGILHSCFPGFLIGFWLEKVMPSFGEMIQECRENFGPAPREMRPEEQDEFRLRPSCLMRIIFLLSMDKLRLVVRHQNLLRDHGRVVWGFLVQANQILFNP